MTNNKIEMEINNGRTMQLSQQKYDGMITITIYDTITGWIESKRDIAPEDMVTTLNWYRYQKDNGNRNLEF